MASVILNGDTSGSVTISPPAVAGTQTVTLPAASGVLQVSGNMPAFRAYANSTTTINNSTFTKITIGAEDFDTNNNFASSRFTPTVAGYYQINAGVEFDLTTSPGIAAIYKNGALVSLSGSIGQSATFDSTPSVSDLVYLNGSTDYVELYGIQASGSSKPTVANTNTHLSGFLARTA